MITVLIPACDIRDQNKPHLEGLLDSLAAGEFPGKIVVAFDACKQDFVEYFIEKYPHIMGLHNSGNRLQFTRNVNQGIKFILSQDPESHILLVNQDVILPHWKRLKDIERPGLSTAQSINLWQEPGEVNLDWLNEYGFNFDLVSPVEKFPFYCTFINNAVIQKIGILDGVFRRCFSDDDYCLRAALAGFPIECLPIPIVHYGTHIDMNKTGESASGCYTNSTLGQELAQYSAKWASSGISHDKIISSVLEKFDWVEEMKISS